MGAPITALLAERRAALRSIDFEALQARAASLGNQPGLAATAAAAAVAGAPRRAASLSAGNAAAFERVSRHDRTAAQLQSQLAAEAAAFVSARSAHTTAKERFLAAGDAAGTLPAAAGEILAAEAPAGEAKAAQPPPGPQVPHCKSALGVVEESPAKQEAGRAPEPLAASQESGSFPPAVKPDQHSVDGVESTTSPQDAATPVPIRTVTTKKAEDAPPATPQASQQAAKSAPVTVAPVTERPPNSNPPSSPQQADTKPAKTIPAAQTPRQVRDAGVTSPAKEQAPQEAAAPLMVPATSAKEPELVSASSWAPTTPDQSMEALPTSIKPECKTPHLPLPICVRLRNSHIL